MPTIVHAHDRDKQNTSSGPTSVAGRQIGNDRKRSWTPFWMSRFNVRPVSIVIMATVIARIPGSTSCR